MTKAEIQALLDEAPCYSCYGSQLEVLNLLLLRRSLLALNPNADTTPSAIQSGCVNCFGASLADQLKFGLLEAIGIAYTVEAFAARAEITDDAQIAALNTLVFNAKNHGWWDKCDLIYPFVGGTALAHSQNLRSSSFTITWNGTVTHDANGITGDGTTGYGDTGYIPASSGQIALDNAHLSCYRRTSGAVSSGNAYLGCKNISSFQRLTIIGQSATSTSFFINSFVGNFPSTVNSGFCAGTRNSSASITCFNLGVLLIITVASTVVPTTNCLILSSTVGLFSSANLAGATMGRAVSDREILLMSSDWQTFQTALGRQV